MSIARGIRQAVLAAIIVTILSSSTSAEQALKVVGDHFEFNGQPRFLVFVSYFDGMRRLRTGNVFDDFEYLKRLGVDGIRILPMWFDVPGQVLSQETVCDGNGVPRPQRLEDLKRLVDYARGYFVVDVTFTAELIPKVGGSEMSEMTLEQYKNCIKEIAVALKPARHVLFDLQNESELNGPADIALDDAQVRELRDVIKGNDAAGIAGVDPDRIVVTSVSGGDVLFANQRAAVGQLDAVAYHDPRVGNWYTQARMQPIIATLRSSGRPAYLQEPQKYQNQRSLTAANFREAVQNAKRLGAAAWCFHTEAGFRMNNQPFSPEPVEAEFLETFREPLDQTPWGVNPYSPYYSVRLFTSNQLYFLAAVNGGGGNVRASDQSHASESSFVLHDLNGGELMSGDRVTLRTSNDVNYLQAQNGGGGLLTAEGPQEDAWETFVIEKMTGEAPPELAYPYRAGSAIRHADWVVLRTPDPSWYISPEPNNPNANVPVNATGVGVREHIEFLFESKNPLNTYFVAPQTGVSYLIPVDAVANRPWTASSGASWLSIQGASSGVGPSTLSVQVAANTSASARTGQVSVADQTITVIQPGAGCTFAISPGSVTVGRSGTTGSVSVSGTPGGCGWTATATAGWITVTSGATGTGSGSVGYTVAANTTTGQRTGTVAIAERLFTVVQQGNAVPTVSITAPASGTIVNRSTPITISASASDSDGSVSRVDFFADGIRLGSATTAPYSFVWQNPGVGWHTLTAEAFDDLGAPGASAPVAVGVNNLDTISFSPASPRSGQAVSISVTGVNPCGAVGLDFGDGEQIVYAISALPMTQSHTWATGGQKTVTATAHGNCAGVLSANITVIANAPPSVSLTAPAAGSTFAVPATITLSANASDSDGSIARVEFYTGSSLLGSDTTAPYSMVWTNAAEGSHVLTAQAIDDIGARTTSTSVTITVARKVTGVSVSPNPIVTGQQATVTVAGSPACGAVEINYGDGSWQTYAITGFPFSQTHTWTTSGTLTITATGHGDCSGQASTGITVNTNPPPSVSLTAPAAGTVYTTGASVTLTATASDAHGVAAVEFYAGATLLGTDTTAPYSVTWASIPSGTHSLTARARDIHGAQATSAAVSVSARDVQSVSVSPSALTAGATATITVYGSTVCGAVTINYGDGTAITYAISGLPISRTHVWATGGWKTVTATGQSSCIGQASTSVYVNTPPNVNLTSPVNGNTYDGPASIGVAATASDADGSVTQVAFYANGTWLGTDTTAPYSLTWSNVPIGTYTVTAVAIDNAGASTSAAATVTVVNPGPSRLTSIVVSPSPVGVGQSATVIVYGTNPCGAVQVNFGDGQAPVMPITELPYVVNHVWYSPGTYTLTAIGHGNCAGQVSTTLVVQ